jgi:hypothetical protein
MSSQGAAFDSGDLLIAGPSPQPRVDCLFAGPPEPASPLRQQPVDRQDTSGKQAATL